MTRSSCDPRTLAVLCSTALLPVKSLLLPTSSLLTPSVAYLSISCSHCLTLAKVSVRASQDLQ